MSQDKKTIVSALSVAPQPVFKPSMPSELPNVAKSGSVSITSPSLGSCKPNISWVLNSSQIGLTITGQDVLPSTDCAQFTDDVASGGIQAKLSNVPYPNGGSVTVNVDLSR